MAKKVILVCDLCNNDEMRPTTQYRVSRKGAARTFDLCTEHGAQLEKILSTKARYSSGAARRMTDTIVSTIEDIEKLATQSSSDD